MGETSSNSEGRHAVRGRQRLSDVRVHGVSSYSAGLHVEHAEHTVSVTALQGCVRYVLPNTHGEQAAQRVSVSEVQSSTTNWPGSHALQPAHTVFAVDEHAVSVSSGQVEHVAQTRWDVGVASIAMYSPGVHA